MLLTSIDASFSRSRLVREKALVILQEKMVSLEKRNLSEDIFKLIADWHHMALLTLFEFKHNTSEDWLAKRLGITTQQVKMSLLRFKSLSLVKLNRAGQYVPDQELFIHAQGVPSESIKSFHYQMLEKAKEALYRQPLDEREFSMMFLAIDPSQLKEAKLELQEFRKKFEKKYSNNVTKKKEVYALGLQYFKVSQKEKT
jgi:uncharacterized protein (TIGR02147 family)